MKIEWMIIGYAMIDNNGAIMTLQVYANDNSNNKIIIIITPAPVIKLN